VQESAKEGRGVKEVQVQCRGGKERNEVTKTPEKKEAEAEAAEKV